LLIHPAVFLTRGRKGAARGSGQVGQGLAGLSIRSVNKLLTMFAAAAGSDVNAATH
jgi:hypothetical protein